MNVKVLGTCSSSHDKFTDFKVELLSKAVSPAAKTYTASNISAGSVCNFRNLTLNIYDDHFIKDTNIPEQSCSYLECHVHCD